MDPPIFDIVSSSDIPPAVFMVLLYSPLNPPIKLNIIGPELPEIVLLGPEAF
jgi:hypothetical protein